MGSEDLPPTQSGSEYIHTYLQMYTYFIFKYILMLIVVIVLDIMACIILLPDELVLILPSVLCLCYHFTCKKSTLIRANFILIGRKSSKDEGDL